VYNPDRLRIPPLIFVPDSSRAVPGTVVYHDDIQEGENRGFQQGIKTTTEALFRVIRRNRYGQHLPVRHQAPISPSAASRAASIAWSMSR
jgi:hypothetical protein